MNHNLSISMCLSIILLAATGCLKQYAYVKPVGEFGEPVTFYFYNNKEFTGHPRYYRFIEMEVYQLNNSPYHEENKIMWNIAIPTKNKIDHVVYGANYPDSLSLNDAQPLKINTLYSVVFVFYIQGHFRSHVTKFHFDSEGKMVIDFVK